MLAKKTQKNVDTPATAATSEPEPVAAASPSILIVEDEQDLLELLRYNLDREGYEVQGATTGEEAPPDDPCRHA